MPTFAQFTRAEDNAPVIINPQHVIHVRSVGGRSWISTTGTASDGNSVVFIVAEEAEEVLQRLSGVSPIAAEMDIAKSSHQLLDV